MPSAHYKHMCVYTLKRPVHASWVIAIGCLCFVVGVWATTYATLGHWWILAAGCVGIALSLWLQKVYVFPLLVASCFSVGVFYGTITKGELSIYRQLIGSQIVMTGRIKEDPTLNDRGQWIVQLDQIGVGGRSLPGSVWASLIGKHEIKRSEKLTIEGELEEGFGTFSGVIYTAKVKAVLQPSTPDHGRVVRDWFADAIRRAIPEPQASLGIGYLTGQKSALPKDLSEALQIAGLSHIVVASGYNLTILVRLSRRLFMKISKYVSAVSSGMLVICFIAVTGLSPSMTRAGLVSGLSLLTWYYGRRFHPFVLLPFAAAITVAIQPSYAWGDLGWQLSFAAFAGVMIIAPLLQRFFFGEKDPGTLRQILGETVAAHLITVPIVLLAFGVISNVAIPANLLIVPLVPLAMLLTFISGMAGLLVPAVANFIALPATWLLTYMTETAQHLAGLPWAQLHIKVEWWGGIVYYAILIGLCIYAKRVTKMDLREVNLVE